MIVYHIFLFQFTTRYDISSVFTIALFNNNRDRHKVRYINLVYCFFSQKCIRVMQMKWETASEYLDVYLSYENMLHNLFSLTLFKIAKFQKTEI